MTPERPHNRVKAPFYGLTLLIGIFCAIFGVISGSTAVLALGLVGALGSLGALLMVRSGRNLRWFLSPLDPRP